MSQVIPEQVSAAQNADRYKTLVVILTVFTTVITAIVAGLQADVNIRASTSNRASQVNAILVTGELQRQSLQTAYDTGVMASFIKDTQEANVLQLTALEQQQSGDTHGSTASLQQAAVAQARADTAMKFSVFFNDTRYTPKSAGAMPDMQAYLSDAYATANALLIKQNSAADAYNRWNRKGDSYTSVLTVLAVALFLFGLAQALSSHLRLLFAIFGVVVLIGAGFWTLVILVN